MEKKNIDLEVIKKEAKEIMDNFLKELKEIEVEKDYKNYREENLRGDNKSNGSIEEKKEFRKQFFKNAPKNSEDYLITKKGDWVK